MRLASRSLSSKRTPEQPWAPSVPHQNAGLKRGGAGLFRRPKTGLRSTVARAKGPVVTIQGACPLPIAGGDASPVATRCARVVLGTFHPALTAKEHGCPGLIPRSYPAPGIVGIRGHPRFKRSSGTPIRRRPATPWRAPEHASVGCAHRSATAWQTYARPPEDQPGGFATRSGVRVGPPRAARSLPRVSGSDLPSTTRTHFVPPTPSVACGDRKGQAPQMVATTTPARASALERSFGVPGVPVLPRLRPPPAPTGP